MANPEQEDRLPKRRPFTFDIDSKMIDVLKAYDTEDELIFNHKPKDRVIKRKRFIK